MAKELKTKIKLQIPGGQANPAPPIGPALGQHGVNIMEFCKQFNAATAKQDGLVIPVVISIYKDRSFTFITKSPPASSLLKRAAGLAKGSGVPVANSPYYDFLHLLKLAIEGEKSFEPEKVKRALDNVKGYQGLLGTINFTPENHTAIGIDDIALASVASGKDPRAMGIFREMAK